MSRLSIRTVREYPSLASTSDTAFDLVLGGDVELPLLVVAHEQTAGRGRGENRWWSDSGSLTFSIAFEPSSIGLRREHEPRIALAAAVAIVRVCEQFVPQATFGIRWPNDIECLGKKLGGLLPESLDGKHILGVGLNVSTELARSPIDIQRMATTLVEQGSHLNKDLVRIAVLSRISETLSQLADDDPELAEAWNWLDTLRGTKLRLKLGSEIIEGIGSGIAEDGSLRVQTETGERIFHGGQVLREPF